MGADKHKHKQEIRQNKWADRSNLALSLQWFALGVLNMECQQTSTNSNKKSNRTNEHEEVTPPYRYIDLHLV